MPLAKGCSRTVISKNIRKLQAESPRRSRAQTIAIALSEARRTGKGRKCRPPPRPLIPSPAHRAEGEVQPRINKELGVYIFYTPRGGHSAYGFQNAARDMAAYSEITGKSYNTAAVAAGTMKGLHEYERAQREAGEISAQTGRRATLSLTPQLIGLEGRRVEVIDKYGERRRFIVGRSTGWVPIHLEIARINSSGGGGVTGAPFRSVRVIPGGRR